MGRKSNAQKVNDTRDELRKACEADFYTYIRFVRPDLYLGHVHEDLISFLMDSSKKNKLVLIPREHLKSTIAALFACWLIVRDPSIRILYVSSTSSLAKKQLRSIKEYLESDRHMWLWPDLIKENEADRQKWAADAICVDHHLRKERFIRDDTVFAAGLTTSITGHHCDVAILDDFVVRENAYKPELREQVELQYSLLSSVETTGAREYVFGTRYHPDDLYGKMIQMEKKIFDKDGNIVNTVPVFDVFLRQVENVGDGSGEFLWPRAQAKDGRWFGFNREILEEKRAKYQDPLQFRAQYYNDPTDPGLVAFKKEYFQYYDPGAIRNTDGSVFINGRKLNVVTSVDFAYSISDTADYTVVMTVGMDSEYNVFVLDIDRFRTTSMQEYLNTIWRHYIKWSPSKLVVEVNNAQKVIADTIRRELIQKRGLFLPMEEVHNNSASKEERIFGTLLNKYEAREMWHYRGGNCEILEQELLTPNSTHDDVKDALALAVSNSTPPVGLVRPFAKDVRADGMEIAHPRFGGIF